MSSIQSAVKDAGWRDYMLAEFRCALIRAKLAQLDIEAIGSALKYNIVTPDQAVEMLWSSDAGRLFGVPSNGGTP